MFLDTLSKNIGVSGLGTGRVSQLGAAAGVDKKAIDFQTARNNLKVQAQSIIKGTPSNFDVQTFIDTLPDITEPQSANRSRINATRSVLKQLVADTIAYHKYSGHRIPPNIAERAKQAGIDPEGITPYDGQGSATKNAEALLKAAQPAKSKQAQDTDGAQPQNQISLEPAEHKGRRMRDVDGKIYRSDGKSWVLEQ